LTGFIIFDRVSLDYVIYFIAEQKANIIMNYTENAISSTRNIDQWVNDAIGDVKRRNHKHLTKNNFLSTVSSQSLSFNILSQLNVAILDFQDEADAIASQVDSSQIGEYEKDLIPETTKFFERINDTKTRLGDNNLFSHHILLTLVNEPEFKEIFSKHGVNEHKIINLLPSVDKEVPTKYASSNASSVNSSVSSDDNNKNSNEESGIQQYGKDLTRIAADGKMDPVVGRDKEIRQVVQMLSRRNKNNPVVVGLPGVGKSSLIEGLAQRIVNRDVPKNLLDKRLISLDMTSIIAGAKMRGEFEQRFKKVLEEASDSSGDIILFIDEIHTITENGAAEILKPMLARGTLRLVGATTIDEYRENIEKDSALERRFQRIDIEEPSISETVTILRGIVSRYEAHHEVEITDDALVAAAHLSERYVSDRALPDKAIDVIDEAATRLRMELDSSPHEIDDVQRQLDLLKMEEIALEKGSDNFSTTRLTELQSHKSNVEEELRNLRAQWKSEQELRSKITTLKVERDNLEKKADELLKNNEYQDASFIRYDNIPEVIKEIESLEEEFAMVIKTPLVPDHVGSDEVAAIVAAWTGIPVGKLLEGEAQRLIKMEETINSKVIGQTDAVSAVSDAVRRSRAGVNDPNRPTGSFMFLGPSGSGKTFFAKTLAKFLFDDENAMVRVDMSEFSEKHSVARLVGAPPGYAGYEAGGQLTEAVRNKPYSVVLLDEVEKAHAEVFDILLQVFDDGRLTDGQGTTVDFRNTIIVLTSNLGASALIDDTLSTQEQHDYVMDAVKSSFRPEFINRLDEIVIFNALSQEELRVIVNLQVADFANRLSHKNIGIKVSDEAMDWLSENGYDPAYGARPLRRLIQKQIGDTVAMMILEGKLYDGQTAIVEMDEATEELNIVAVATSDLNVEMKEVIESMTNSDEGENNE